MSGRASCATSSCCRSRRRSASRAWPASCRPTATSTALPCHASPELLTTILRDEWGFDGIVASDYTAVQMLVGQHRLTGDLGTAAGDGAAGRGSTASCRRRRATARRSRRALDDGRVDPALVDLAVERILRLKFRLGLFERPYVDLPSVAELDQMDAEERSLAADLVRRSIVLLENDGVLPLGRRRRDGSP